MIARALVSPLVAFAAAPALASAGTQLPQRVYCSPASDLDRFVKNQLIVALARGLGVDWWRIRTGQTTANKLGLVMAD